VSFFPGAYNEMMMLQMLQIMPAYVDIQQSHNKFGNIIIMVRIHIQIHPLYAE
jgi:hypothetical protein